MRLNTIIIDLGLLLSVDACRLFCDDGTNPLEVPRWGPTPCPGKQLEVWAAPGYADIVYFDGGKRHQCADHEGFSLRHIKENVVGCDNGVKGTCCGFDRCK